MLTGRAERYKTAVKHLAELEKTDFKIFLKLCHLIEYNCLLQRKEVTQCENSK